MLKTHSNNESVIELAKELLKKYKGRIEIPTDIAPNIDGKRFGTNVSGLPQNHSLYDIGIDTLVNYINCNKSWNNGANGPMGVLKIPSLLLEQMEIFSAISKSGGMTVVKLEVKLPVTFNQMGLADGINTSQQEEVRTYLFMSGETMPALEAMRKSKNNCK